MEAWRAEEALSRTLREIQAEKAAALARIAATLEDLLAELGRIARTAEASAPDPRLVSRHQELRARALRYRWYLEVQREAVG
ncbi:MAG TPA: hypothetical protein VFO85_05785, partial [Vicinamibacteria bacterium]|nr:hypothetical protein [Vicinamibacteria bacterium]